MDHSNLIIALQRLESAKNSQFPMHVQLTLMIETVIALADDQLASAKDGVERFESFERNLHELSDVIKQFTKIIGGSCAS